MLHAGVSRLHAGRYRVGALRDVDTGCNDAHGPARCAFSFEKGLGAGIQLANRPVIRTDDAELSAAAPVAAGSPRRPDRFLELPAVFGMNRVREEFGQDRIAGTGCQLSRSSRDQ